MSDQQEPTGMRKDPAPTRYAPSTWTGARNLVVVSLVTAKLPARAIVAQAIASSITASTKPPCTYDGAPENRWSSGNSATTASSSVST